MPHQVRSSQLKRDGVTPLSPPSLLSKGSVLALTRRNRSGLGLTTIDGYLLRTAGFTNWNRQRQNTLLVLGLNLVSIEKTVLVSPVA